MPSRRQFLAATASGLSLAGFSARLRADSGKPLQIVVGAPAGGGTDILARRVADKLRAFYPEGVMVDNRPGASTRIALDYVKSAPADGKTLLLTPDFPFTIFPHAYKKLSYDPIHDFAPVATCVRSGLTLSVGPLVPASVRTVADFVQWSKANPSQAAFASGGAGGIFHLLGVLFNRSTGLAMTHVPYKGGALALQDLVGGQIAASFNGIGEALPFYKTGRIRTLATFGPTRSPYMPDVPTMAELGYRNFVVESWIGLFAPAKTPAHTVVKLNATIGEILKDEAFGASMAKLGLETYSNTPASFATIVKADMARWAPVVKASGFTADE